MAEEQVANGAQDGAPKTGGKEKKGFFYGWWIVIGGFMIMATCYTAFVNCMSLFQAQIVGDLGMTIGEYNTGTSLASLISIVGTLIIGFLLDKINARAEMIRANVPVIPGSDGEVFTAEEALEVANRLGYPVMLKASAPPARACSSRLLSRTGLT